PADHPLRRIDDVLDLSELRARLKPFYSAMGRPSVDPELMVRMLLVGYCFGIRSERRLCQEVHLNLAYRWFCRLGLDGSVPDHSTFSLNRHGRFRESDAFRLVFESVVRRCMAAGLVAGEGFAVDASVLEADASRYHGVPGDEAIDWSDPTLSTRAVREYLAGLDPTPDETRKPPKVISRSDPCSAWTAKANKRVMFGYGLNYLIDTEHAIIVDVEATPARTKDEVAATRTMIERTDRRLGLKPGRLAADTAYGTGAFLGWLVDQGIAPHIPVWDRSRRVDGTFSRQDFIYDRERDRYVCPGGKTLATTGKVHADNTYRYRASSLDCAGCPLKPHCCPNTAARKVPRDVHEDARDQARSLAATEPFARSRNQRKKVEMLFAHLKRHLGFARLRLRGLSGARDEFLLAATVQNLKRLATLTAIPPPQPSTA
ncbi:MAG TPA: IS5/IS1182 family transposase, partial [Kiloniellaceae bacterium]|nr:IS5/IS1182 family transposase [Kiloniellaceae bacterium]